MTRNAIVQITACIGIFESPFLTIQAAAKVAMPGDTVIVHEGVYREKIVPPRGGESDTQRHSTKH